MNEFSTSIVKIDDTIYIRVPAPLSKFLNLAPSKDAKILETDDKRKLTVVLP